MIVRYAAIGFENYRYFWEEGGPFVLLKPITGLKGHTIGSFLQIFACWIEFRDPTLLVGGAGVEGLPVLTIFLF